MKGKPRSIPPKKLLLWAALSLVAALFIVQLMIAIRPRPKYIDKKAFVPVVKTRVVEKGPREVAVKVYGEARSAKIVTLHAVTPGRIVYSSDPFLGEKVARGQVLFQVDPSKLDLDITSANAQIEELKIRTDQEAELLDAEKKRLEIWVDLFSVSERTVQKQREILDIEGKLSDKFEKLFDKDTISNTEYLRSEEAYRRAQLALLNAENNLQRIADGVEQIRQGIVLKRFSLETLSQNLRSAISRLEKLQQDRDKVDISSPFSARVTEVLVEEGQEVLAGASLAKVRSVDEVEFLAFLPDVYFPWLYQGDLLEDPLSASPLSIDLVSYDFKKSFNNAFIKAMGGQVAQATRSLPILLARKNPLGEDGFPEPEEELMPGMYCSLNLPLCLLENVFVIPPTAIQDQDEIYYVRKENETFVLGVLHEVEMLLEDEGGLIVRLPENISSLRIVTQPLRNVEEGQEVRLNGQEPS